MVSVAPMPEQLPEGWTANPGFCPEELAGTEAKVLLMMNHGGVAGPWPAWGRGACKWDRDPDYAFAIRAYRVAK